MSKTTNLPSHRVYAVTRNGKRSFWWRLLGRGRDNKSKDNPPPPPPKRPEGD